MQQHEGTHLTYATCRYLAVLFLAGSVHGQSLNATGEKIAADPLGAVITFATSKDSTQPLAEFHGEQVTGGILKDLGDAIAANLHRKAVFIIVPRKRLDMDLEKGAVDGVCYYRPEWVDAKLNWSQPFIPNVILLVGREGAPAPDKLEYVAGKVLGTVLGYKYPELDALHGDYRRDDAPNMASNIKKLENGRFEYAIVDQLSLDFHRKVEQNIGAISTLPITTINASCGFSPVSKIPFGEINSAIIKMVKQGTVDKILAKYR